LKRQKPNSPTDEKSQRIFRKAFFIRWNFSSVGKKLLGNPAHELKYFSSFIIA